MRIKKYINNIKMFKYDILNNLDCSSEFDAFNSYDDILNLT